MTEDRVNEGAFAPVGVFDEKRIYVIFGHTLSSSHAMTNKLGPIDKA